MKKIVKTARFKPKPHAVSKSEEPVAKHVPTHKAKPDFIGRLKGVFRIVGDIESPVEPSEWECCGKDDRERINQAAEGINAEASHVLDYQTIGRPEFPADAKKLGRGRSRHAI
jgi:hypothetical protein